MGSRTSHYRMYGIVCRVGPRGGYQLVREDHNPFRLRAVVESWPDEVRRINEPRIVYVRGR